MHFHTSHPLQPFWNMAAAPIQAQAVEQAIEYQLFTLLSESASADDVAVRLGLNPAATSVWLDLLWSLELLTRHVPLTSPASPLLREGFDPTGAVSDAAPKGSWAQAAREQIAQEQRAITVPTVLRLLQTLPPLPQTGR